MLVNSDREVTSSAPETPSEVAREVNEALPWNSVDPFIVDVSYRPVFSVPIDDSDTGETGTGGAGLGRIHEQHMSV